MSRHHNARDAEGRERFTFPDHITRDGRAVWRPLPPGPGRVLDPPTARQCIACGARVRSHQSEACPHE